MPGKDWNAAEVEVLRIGLTQGLAPSEIWIGMRTTSAIRAKAARLGLIGDGVSRREWPEEDERLLRQLCGQGWNPLRIHESGQLRQYSYTAIVKKRTRLGLSDPSVSSRSRQCIRLTEEETKTFHGFLRYHVARCTPEQMALMWNEQYSPEVSRARVLYHLRKLKLNRPWKEVISMPYSKAKQRRVSRKQVQSQETRRQHYHFERSAELRRLAVQVEATRRSVGGNCPQRSCRDCREEWPAEPPFFTVTRKSDGREYLGRICPLCRKDRRREGKAAS